MAVVLGALTRSFAGVAATGIVIVFSVLAAVGLGGWVRPAVHAPHRPRADHRAHDRRRELRAPADHPAAADAGRGTRKREAIVESVRVNVHPVFLACLTTALGFLSMNFSEVPPYRHLGTFVAFGVGASFCALGDLPAGPALHPPDARPGRPAGRRPRDGGPRGLRGPAPDGAALGVRGGGRRPRRGRPPQRAERRPHPLLRRERGSSAGTPTSWTST